MTLDLSLADGRVLEVGHKVRGCLLCQAPPRRSASARPGETPAALRAVAQDLGEAIARAPETAGRRWPELAAFAPVHAHKSRHECVLLPFQALAQALDWPSASPLSLPRAQAASLGHVPTRRKPVRCRTDAISGKGRLRHAAGWLPIT